MKTVYDYDVISFAERHYFTASAISSEQERGSGGAKVVESEGGRHLKHGRGRKKQRDRGLGKDQKWRRQQREINQMETTKDRKNKVLQTVITKNL